jgi:hypothetical protein
MPLSIPLLETRQAIKEMGSTGHHPVQFLCNDDHIWFCKYVLDVEDPHQTDLLYYELIGTALLRQLGIDTPDVALVRITEGSFTPEQLPNNAKHMQPGVVAFGSKRMLGDVVDDLLYYRTANEFSKLKNPEDLLRIALFDLWVANRDRGKELWDRPGQHNFNLLQTPMPGGHRLVPIDHASILGDTLELRAFHPSNLRLSVDGTLFQTRLCSSVMHHLGAEMRNRVLDDFLTSVSRTSPDDLFATLHAARPHWEYPPGFDTRLSDFLWDPSRLARLEAEARNFFQHPAP